jgi:predicted DNA-binding transcriptional regulator AlpA
LAVTLNTKGDTMDDQKALRLLPVALVRARYGGISLMGLHRWINGPVSFPKPVKIGSKNFWRIGELDDFDAGLKTEKGRSPRKAT